MSEYADRGDVVVLALPRGGVPVAYEVARRLGAPLDVFVVRKLGVPGHKELAMGAVAPSGALVLNDDLIAGLGIVERTIDSIVVTELQELARRERVYRGDRPPADVHGKTVILVDDGVATGASMRAAVAGLRELSPERIIIAVPVAAASTCEELSREGDEVVCPMRPEPFFAVGLWYVDFEQTSDDEVRVLLGTSGRASAATETGASERL